MIETTIPLFTFNAAYFDDLSKKADQLIEAKKTRYEDEVEPLCKDLERSVANLRATLPQIKQMFDLLSKLSDNGICSVSDLKATTPITIDFRLFDKSIVDNDPHEYLVKMDVDGQLYAHCQYFMMASVKDIEVSLDYLVSRLKEYGPDTEFVQDIWILVNNSKMKNFVNGVKRIEKELPLLAEAVAEYIRTTYDKTVGAE